MTLQYLDALGRDSEQEPFRNRRRLIRLGGLTGFFSIGFVVALAAVGQSTSGGAPCAGPSLTSAVREACLGDEASKRALALPAQSDARRDELEAAALHYRRAADALSGEGKLRALDSLAQTYGAQRLGRSAQEEIIRRELIALAPNEPRHSFDLAALQEAGGFPDSAEETLLSVRRQQPQEPEAVRRLAQFYVRRFGALTKPETSSTSAEPVTAGERDADGVYRIGGQLPPPSRAGPPRGEGSGHPRRGAGGDRRR